MISMRSVKSKKIFPWLFILFKWWTRSCRLKKFRFRCFLQDVCCFLLAIPGLLKTGRLSEKLFLKRLLFSPKFRGSLEFSGHWPLIKNCIKMVFDHFNYKYDLTFTKRTLFHWWNRFSICCEIFVRKFGFEFCKRQSCDSRFFLFSAAKIFIGSVALTICSIRGSNPVMYTKI